MTSSPLVWFACLALLFATHAAHAQPKTKAYKPPKDIVFRKANVISEGTRMTAELFVAKAKGNKRLPTIIMCHGWGGVAEMLRPDAVAFARAGYFVVTFDYRGWGQSDGRLVLVKPAKKGKPGEPFQATVKEIREVVDPLDQTTDLLNVIHWVQAEKQCDPSKIGLWGSSYSGGHVVYAAQHDPRVKATVSQVPAMDSRWVMFGLGKFKTLSDATKRTRGKLDYPRPGKTFRKLRGVPIRERMINYAPVEHMDKAPKCAMLFVVAEKEELFNNRDHAVLAHERAKGPKKLVAIPNIKHYGIYNEARSKAQNLAIEWYNKHLMKKK